MHVDTFNTTVQNIIHLMVQMSTLSIQTILVNLMILSLNLMKYTHWNCYCSCSLLYQQHDERGQLNPNLSFFEGGWDPILIEGCDSLVGGQGHLGWRSELEFPS